MSTPSQATESQSIEREQRAVIERIAKSPFFAGAQKRIDLLWYLFEHRKSPVSDWDIARDVFGFKRRQDYRSGKARGQCRTLSQKLEQYTNEDISSDQWHCFLPPVEGNEGYRLRMKNLFLDAGIVHAFWQAHLEPPRPVTIVCNEPLFYRDRSATTVIRVPHMDTPGNGKDMQVVPDAVKKLLAVNFKEPLFPCHLYTLAGEIGARDVLAQWFSDEANTRTEMKISRRIEDVAAEIKKSSPILFGNAHTNKLIDKITQLHQYKGFAYRLGAEGFGTVEVRNPNENERDILKRYLLEGTGQSNRLVLHDNPQPDNVVFSVVTRLPNPYGEGAITILGASYTKVLEEIASTLTDEESLEELLQQTQWSPRSKVPRYFEGLFSVRLDQVGIDAEVEKPKLRCWRNFESNIL